MAREGFDPTVRHRRDRTEIVLRNCPFESAALADPDTVCSLHLGIARGLAEGTPLAVDDLIRRDPGAPTACCDSVSKKTPTQSRRSYEMSPPRSTGASSIGKSCGGSTDMTIIERPRPTAIEPAAPAVTPATALGVFRRRAADRLRVIFNLVLAAVGAVVLFFGAGGWALKPSVAPESDYDAPAGGCDVGAALTAGQ